MADAPRPHYSEEERERLEAKLMVGRRSKDHYFCFHCGGKDISRGGAVKLRTCARCRQVWFCGKECMKAAWKSGHKEECYSGLENVIRIPDFRKPEIEDSIADTGVAAFFSPNSGNHVFVRDTSTGQIFDSLTDRNVYFLPSQTEEFRTNTRNYSFTKRMEALVGECHSKLCKSL